MDTQGGPLVTGAGFGNIRKRPPAEAMHRWGGARESQPVHIRLTTYGESGTNSDNRVAVRNAQHRILHIAGITLQGLCGSLLFAGGASAHVKWFSEFDLEQQPRGVGDVLCAEFAYLLGVSVILLMLGATFERTGAGEKLVRYMNATTAWMRNNTELMIRAGCGFFFVSVWALGGILLTPELKTDSIAVGALQLAIAAGTHSRKTMPFSAAGIVGLFFVGIQNYGVFHLADYPVFLGVAAYLALVGLQRSNFLGAAPIDILRWSVGITLMWASIEKWAYPEWSFPLLGEPGALVLGLDAEFFMRAAGAVEFALAFSIIWTPLVRRIGAIFLALMFVSAVIGFGKLDLIGHAIIVVSLCAVIADDRPGRSKAAANSPKHIPVAFGGAVIVFFALYYVGHAAMVTPQIV